MTASARAPPTGSSRGVVMVDVARLAGVSQKTVSRVVNGAPHVRPDVRERVNRAIEELGYRPNVPLRRWRGSAATRLVCWLLGTRFLDRRDGSSPSSMRPTAGLHHGSDFGAGFVCAQCRRWDRRVVEAGVEGLGGGGADPSDRYRPRATCRIARGDERWLDHRCSASSRGGRRPGRSLSRADRLPPRFGARDGLARGGAT